LSHLAPMFIMQDDRPNPCSFPKSSLNNRIMVVPPYPWILHMQISTKHRSKVVNQIGTRCGSELSNIIPHIQKAETRAEQWGYASSGRAPA
jgi:hypothetical protein